MQSTLNHYDYRKRALFFQVGNGEFFKLPSSTAIFLKLPIRLHEEGGQLVDSICIRAGGQWVPGDRNWHGDGDDVLVIGD